MAVAQAFPEADVLGVDADVASIEDARKLAAERGIGARFEAADASELAGHGPFDGVLILEALHDMANPVEVLAAARAALAEGGSVVVADEAVADSFVAPGDDIERMMYGWSIIHCLPASMVEQPSAAIGTAIRADTVRELAADAGFADLRGAARRRRVLPPLPAGRLEQSPEEQGGAVVRRFVASVSQPPSPPRRRFLTGASSAPC